MRVGLGDGGVHILALDLAREVDLRPRRLGADHGRRRNEGGNEEGAGMHLSLVLELSLFSNVLRLDLTRRGR